MFDMLRQILTTQLSSLVDHQKGNLMPKHSGLPHLGQKLQCSRTVFRGVAPFQDRQDGLVIQEACESSPKLLRSRALGL